MSNSHWNRALVGSKQSLLILTLENHHSGGETPFSVGRLCNVTSKNFGLFSGFAENSHGSPISS